jgi:hypothetical protein
MKASEWIFKGGLLAIGVAFVIVYFLASQNGRYHYCHFSDSNTMAVVDTRTGIISFSSFSTFPLQILHLDLINNKSTGEIFKTPLEVAPPIGDVKNEPAPLPSSDRKAP